MKGESVLRHRPLWLSLLFLAGGLACWSAYASIGAEVDAQGALREPFALIPIGWLLFFASVIAAGVYGAGRAMRYLRRNKK